MEESVVDDYDGIGKKVLYHGFITSIHTRDLICIV